MRPALEVLCDFDGTVAHEDTVDLVLARLADPAWRVLEARWVRGEIDSRACMGGQIALIRGGWTAVRGVLADVVLDRTFAAFAGWCRRQDIRLRIVSGGIDRVIHHLLARDRIAVDAVWASHLVERADGGLGLDFPRPLVGSRCGSGFCKCALFTRPFGATRPLRVLVGDGRSDFCCAHRADVVFARAELADYCRGHHVPARPFADFGDVQQGLAHLVRAQALARAGGPLVLPIPVEA
ncbi:MAG TPA: HAD-IB family phosphatase [Candidatus Binatia bacterium]|jgi:2,3-diketo-5-methylthio-1-phosphopentane phosphatase